MKPLETLLRDITKHINAGGRFVWVSKDWINLIYGDADKPDSVKFDNLKRELRRYLSKFWEGEIL